MSEDYSGPAFPMRDHGYRGLSKREYYAIRAPLSLPDVYHLLEKKMDVDSLSIEQLVKILAEFTFVYADAMIEAGKE